MVDLSGSSPQALEPVNGGEATGPGSGFRGAETPARSDDAVQRRLLPAHRGHCREGEHLALDLSGGVRMFEFGHVHGRGGRCREHWPRRWERPCAATDRGHDPHLHRRLGPREEQGEHVLRHVHGGSAATHGQDGFDATANYDKGDFGWFVSTETIENIFPTLWWSATSYGPTVVGRERPGVAWACAGTYACWMGRQASRA